MLTLIPKGLEKILTLFYQNKHKSFYFREIVRETKLHEPSVFRYLQKLEKDKIISHTQDGNLKKFFFFKDHKIFSIFEQYDLKRFEELPSLRKRAIHIFFEMIEQKPVFSLLFGSTAKKTQTQNSDIDILLVVNNKILTQKAEKEVLALTGIQIQIFQITYTAFILECTVKKDYVIQAAIETGFPIYNALEYYKKTL